MTELTFEEFCDLVYAYTLGMTFDTAAQRMYRNDKHGLQHEIHTKRNKRSGKWHSEKRCWYLDNDSREFETVDQLYVAYMEKVCGVKS